MWLKSTWIGHFLKDLVPTGGYSNYSALSKSYQLQIVVNGFLQMYTNVVYNDQISKKYLQEKCSKTNG